jgi:hypothetical protein
VYTNARANCPLFVIQVLFLFYSSERCACAHFKISLSSLSFALQPRRAHCPTSQQRACVRTPPRAYDTHARDVRITRWHAAFERCMGALPHRWRARRKLVEPKRIQNNQRTRSVRRARGTSQRTDDARAMICVYCMCVRARDDVVCAVCAVRRVRAVRALDLRSWKVPLGLVLSSAHRRRLASSAHGFATVKIYIEIYTDNVVF